MGWQWHQLYHMQIICTLLQRGNHTSTSSLNFLQTGCSLWCPVNSVKVLKATGNNTETDNFTVNPHWWMRWCEAHRNVSSVVGCSNGVGRRTLSSRSRHCNTSGVFPRLHAAACDCLPTSRWVLVPSRSYFTQHHLSIYRNVCTVHFLTTTFVLYNIHMLPAFCCTVCCYKRIILSFGRPSWMFLCLELLLKCWSEHWLELYYCQKMTSCAILLDDFLLLWLRLESVDCPHWPESASDVVGSMTEQEILHQVAILWHSDSLLPRNRLKLGKLEKLSTTCVTNGRSFLNIHWITSWLPGCILFLQAGGRSL